MSGAARRLAGMVGALTLALVLPGALVDAQEDLSVAEACPADRVPDSGFTDTAGNTHETAIDCVRWYEVTQGVDGQRYGPAVPVGRDQMASFIARATGQATELPSPSVQDFRDVVGNTHEARILQLAEIGVARGTTASTYSPRVPVSRAQMATFLVRAFEHVSGQPLPTGQDRFADDDRNPHEGNINKAAEAGLTTGTSASAFSPSAAVRRDQMGSFIARMLTKLVADGHMTADPEPQPDPPPPPREDEPEPDDPVATTTQLVAADLAVPWDVAFTPDGAYVTERDSGRVLRLDADGSVETVASFDIDNTGEGGLLGLAPSPDYADDGLLYAYFTTSQDNRIVRFEPGGPPETLVTGIPAAANHDGGRIAFGPDGMLYAGTGDAGNPAHGPDPTSLAGKILRVTPDGGVPADNPSPDSPVFASGLRNPQGLTWDPHGQLYVTEFGPNVDDAVLRVDPGSDQGWGPEVADAGAGVRDFPDPVAVEQPPNASWSGATVLTDGAIPQWEGDLFAAALRGQRLWRFDLATGEGEALHVEEFGRLRHVAQTPGGALWLLTSNRDGRGDPTPSDDRIIRIGP